MSTTQTRQRSQGERPDDTGAFGGYALVFRRADAGSRSRIRRRCAARGRGSRTTRGARSEPSSARGTRACAGRMFVADVRHDHYRTAV
ncbi:hypothetical protein ABZ318_34550 [Streptomyces sp. NPDC006197]|uniref:hypothetical protein n=1 Tax=Streptomyces sp. NPDC006197 TaxID=3156685 RepID=UPI0033A5F3A8